MGLQEKIEVIGEIYVQNPKGEKELLKRLKVDEPRVTLVINFPPEGSWIGQVKRLYEEANKWVSHLKSGHLNQVDTWHALTCTIMMTLEYPMVAISLARDQWDKVMQPLLQALLPRIGITRSFPRLMVYAPLSWIGLGLLHPYNNQHLKQLQTVLRHDNHLSPTGQMFRASYEQMQLERGADLPFLSLPFSEYGNLATSLLDRTVVAIFVLQPSHLAARRIPCSNVTRTKGMDPRTETRRAIPRHGV
jgi:hypothetical protein